MHMDSDNGYQCYDVHDSERVRQLELEEDRGSRDSLSEKRGTILPYMHMS